MKRQILAPFAVILVAALSGYTHQSPERISSLLRPGMQLVYGSGVNQSPMIVDSVSHDTTLGGRSGCVRIRQRASRPDAVLETRAYCSDAMLMYTWDDTSSSPRASRPLRSGDSLRVSLRNGGSAVFTTTIAAAETISARVVRVIPTTVLTRDSTGRVIRRLTERFSIGLATATGGVFEVPDSTQVGGWRVTQRFELTAIRP